MRSPPKVATKVRSTGNCWQAPQLGTELPYQKDVPSKIGKGYSKVIDVTSGVPQGSVLGPVLFLMYINDCFNGLSCDAVMFADDVKIWRTIESSSDVQRLQNDINQLLILSQGALMSLNTDKCVVLRLHPQQAKNNSPQYQQNGKLLR